MSLNFSDEVREALQHKKPVVALESTIISHGMPYPQNLQTAQEVEQIIRDAGATPATIAIIDGNVHVGLDNTLLEKLAKTGTAARKVSRRDIPICLALKETGSTTVSGTMIFAAQAGIDVFVTGGIGGVHRQGENSMDISADLMELGKTPVAVVCAGVKSILDIPRTLEVLETQGVPVVTVGADEFPAFFSRHSGFSSPNRVDDVAVIARMIASNKEYRLNNGILVAVPVPVADQADGLVIEEAIQVALKESSEICIEGKEITPYMLKRVNELTGGKSLKSNIALVKNNALVGAQLAVAMAGMAHHD